MKEPTVSDDPFDGTVAESATTRAPLSPWSQRLRRYPATGEAGFTELDGAHDCRILLWRDETGVLRGTAVLRPDGRVGIQVDPDYQRRGVGTALGYEVARRWGLNLSAQAFTPDGHQWAANVLVEHRGGTATAPPSFDAAGLPIKSGS